jgi:hypothetical protein
MNLIAILFSFAATIVTVVAEPGNRYADTAGAIVLTYLMLAIVLVLVSDDILVTLIEEVAPVVQLMTDILAAVQFLFLVLSGLWVLALARMAAAALQFYREQTGRGLINRQRQRITAKTRRAS